MNTFHATQVASGVTFYGSNMEEDMDNTLVQFLQNTILEARVTVVENDSSSMASMRRSSPAGVEAWCLNISANRSVHHSGARRK